VHEYGYGFLHLDSGRKPHGVIGHGELLNWSVRPNGNDYVFTNLGGLHGCRADSVWSNCDGDGFGWLVHHCPGDVLEQH
jgi:hypothetical protein